MLKIEIDDNHNIRELAYARVDTASLVADVSLAIGALFSCIHQSSPEGAALFKTLIAHVADEDCPAWNARPVDCFSATIPVCRKSKTDDLGGDST